MSERSPLKTAVAVVALSTALFGLAAGTASAHPGSQIGTPGPGKVNVCYQDPGLGKMCEWIKSPRG